LHAGGGHGVAGSGDGETVGLHEEKYLLGVWGFFEKGDSVWRSKRDSYVEVRRLACLLVRAELAPSWRRTRTMGMVTSSISGRQTIWSAVLPPRRDVERASGAQVLQQACRHLGASRKHLHH
jgi:hypothetical protein